MLENQVTDPLCSKCKACANSVRAMKEGLEELKSEDPASLPPEIKNLFKQAQDRIYAVKTAEAAEGQKTAGNCRLLTFIASPRMMKPGVSGIRLQLGAIQFLIIVSMLMILLT